MFFSLCCPLQEMCLYRMAEGLQMYSGLLNVVAGHLTSSQKVSDLGADIKDLLSKVQRVSVHL